jgi:hypothetical protein
VRVWSVNEDGRERSWRRLHKSQWGLKERTLNDASRWRAVRCEPLTSHVITPATREHDAKVRQQARSSCNLSLRGRVVEGATGVRAHLVRGRRRHRWFPCQSPQRSRPLSSFRSCTPYDTQLRAREEGDKRERERACVCVCVCGGGGTFWHRSCGSSGRRRPRRALSGSTPTTPPIARPRV